MTIRPRNPLFDPQNGLKCNISSITAQKSYYSYILAKIYRKCISNTFTSHMVQHILRFITFYNHYSCTVNIAHFRVYLGIVNFSPKTSKVKILFSIFQFAINWSFIYKKTHSKICNCTEDIKNTIPALYLFTVK